MFYVYVIQNEKQKLYKGYTEDLQRRMAEHNSGRTKSTKGSGQWKLVYCEEYDTIEEAIKREKYFKTAAGRRFIKKIGPVVQLDRTEVS